MVSSHIIPSSVPAHTFHVYRLLTSLPVYSSSTLLLPPHGITALLEAKHIDILTYYLFVMIELPNSLQDTKFWKLILGTCLKAWSILPDNPNVHSIWSQYPSEHLMHHKKIQSILVSSGSRSLMNGSKHFAIYLASILPPFSRCPVN
jgi:hypothetical protein